MTDESPTDAARLPHPPEAVLDLLRRAEASLAEVDTIRSEIRAFREALESAEEPQVATVAGAVVLSAESSLTVTASVTTTWNTEAKGHAPPDAEVFSWFDKVKKYGPAGAKIVDFALRVYSTFN